MLNKKLIAVYLSIFLVATSIYGDDVEDMLKITQDKVSKMAVVLDSKKLSDKEKKEKINHIVKDIFDYKVMSKIALGRYWKKISPLEKKDFINLFSHKLKYYYSNKILLFNNQKVEVKKAILVKKKRIEVDTILIGERNTYTIKYKFYKRKDGQWRVYDIVISGISVVKSFKLQFYSFLKTNTFEDLLKYVSK